MAGEQFLDCNELVFGEKFRLHLIETNLPRNGLSRPTIIASQHHNGLDPGRVQLCDNITGVRSNGIGDRDEAADVTGITDNHHGLAFGL